MKIHHVWLNLFWQLFNNFNIPQAESNHSRFQGTAEYNVEQIITPKVSWNNLKKIYNYNIRKETKKVGSKLTPTGASLKKYSSILKK